MPLVDPWLPVAVAGQIPRSSTAVTTFVTRRTQSTPETVPTFTVLNNLTWESINRRIGPDPGVCRLRYTLGNGDPAAPQNFEECLSDQIAKAKTVEPDDRIVVWATRPDGVNVPLFDGFALHFDGHLAASSEGVEIVCVGVAYRLWDTPIRGSTYRRGDDPLNPDGNAEIDFEPHFNPKGRANCSPEGTDGAAWANQAAPGDQRYPVFHDADSSQPDDKGPIPWTLANTARYLIFRHNKTADFVSNPNGSTLDSTLVARIPKEGFSFDYEDSTTFDMAEIEVADKPIASKDWPNTLHGLISDKGFEMAFDLDSIGAPLTPDTTTALRVYLPQTQPIKSLWLQPRGSFLDLAYTNLGEAKLGRDLSHVITTWHVDGELEDVELSLIIPCGFPCVATDAANATAIAAFNKSAGGFAGVQNKYRLFIADESGEGHYAPASETKLTSPLFLDDVFGAPDASGAKYAHRRRVPYGTLLSKGSDGKPLKAQLDISTNYTGGSQTVWTTTLGGTWQRVTKGWELLKDRIGIYITVANPNEWDIGKPTATDQPFKSGVVPVVECLGKNTTTTPKFWLRLTCVIPGDTRVRGTASRPIGAIIRRPITRVIDAHDRYRKSRILIKSALNPTNPTTPPTSPAPTPADVITRDDTDTATAEATAVQLATINGTTGGTATIPWLTTHYEIGDRISHVEGRALGLRADKQTPDGEPTYPVVTAIAWHNSSTQKTTLELSDANPSRHSHLRQIKRKAAPRNV
ncbi:MAG: hypothetical protein M3P94_07235 [Chloroflexota bacterium]|nr:hypothetical protein [Chloroflexota bacterium]